MELNLELIFGIDDDGVPHERVTGHPIIYIYIYQYIIIILRQYTIQRSSSALNFDTKQSDGIISCFTEYSNPMFYHI